MFIDHILIQVKLRIFLIVFFLIILVKCFNMEYPRIILSLIHVPNENLFKQLNEQVVPVLFNNSYYCLVCKAKLLILGISQAERIRCVCQL